MEQEDGGFKVNRREREVSDKIPLHEI